MLLFFFSTKPLEGICLHFARSFFLAHFIVVKCRCYNSGSTRARTITTAAVLVNMCHIRFTLTGRKQGREDRNAAGINIELGSPFLQGISCLVKRWRSDRELWHSVLSHLGRVLQLKTHTVPPLNSSLFGVGRSTVYECKLPQRSHITHLKPVCLEDKWRFLKTPRAEGDSANRHKRLQQNGFRVKASGHEPLKKLIMKHYCVPHWEQSKNNINVIIKCRDTWLFTM